MRTGQTWGLTWMLSRASGSAAGADNSGIDKPKIVAQASVLLQVFQQVRENIGPRAIAAPSSEAAIDRFPRAVALRNVSPGGAGVAAPQDAVEKAVVILKGSATTSAVNAVREKR